MPLLDVLSGADRNAMLQAGQPHAFARNEIIVRHGGRGDVVHLMTTGRVAVRVGTRLGETVTLTMLGPGALFGELGILQPQARRSASVVATAPTETLAWDRAGFRRLRATRPALDEFLADALGQVVRRLSQHLIEALYEPVETRVVRRLLATAPLFGPLRAGLVVQLTQQELASMAGTTRPTVNRVLQELKDAGVLRVGRGQVMLLDVERLRAHAQ